MSDVEKKATRAKRLRDNKDFIEFRREVLDQQAGVFLRHDSTPDEREDAHAIVRALRKLDERLAKAVNAHKHEQKGQHLGSQD